MRRMLARWARSGLTQREFGRRAGVAASTIAWWRHVFRHAGEQGGKARGRRRRPARPRPAAAPAFVEVTRDAAALPEAVPLEIVVRTGQVIRVPRAFDAARLRAVVAALEAPC
jgi:transposase